MSDSGERTGGEFEAQLHSAEYLPRDYTGFDAFNPSEFDINFSPGLILPENPGEIVLRKPDDELRMLHDEYFHDRHVENRYDLDEVKNVLMARLERIFEQSDGEPLFKAPTIYLRSDLPDEEVTKQISRFDEIFGRLEEEMARLMYAQVIRAFNIENKIRRDGPAPHEMPIAASVLNYFGERTASGIHVSRDVEGEDWSEHGERLSSKQQLKYRSLDGIHSGKLPNHIQTSGQVLCDMCDRSTRNAGIDTVVFGSENDEHGVEQLYRKGRANENGKLTMMKQSSILWAAGYGHSVIPVIINMGQTGMHAAAHAGFSGRDPDTNHLEVTEDQALAAPQLLEAA